MSRYVYGEVECECDVQTMARVLEDMVPEWKGKIETSDLGDIKLRSGYESARETYHIRVAHGNSGISYEDFGMRKVGNTWKVALGAHSSVAGKAQQKFEDELPGEIGKHRAKKLINKMNVLGFSEEEDEEEFVFKFKFDGDDLLSGSI